MAISKLAPPAPAGWLSETVKVALLVPALPSFTETSLIDSVGWLGVMVMLTVMMSLRPSSSGNVSLVALSPLWV